MKLDFRIQFYLGKVWVLKATPLKKNKTKQQQQKKTKSIYALIVLMITILVITILQWFHSVSRWNLKFKPFPISFCLPYYNCADWNKHQFEMVRTRLDQVIKENFKFAIVCCWYIKGRALMYHNYSFSEYQSSHLFSFYPALYTGPEPCLTNRLSNATAMLLAFCCVLCWGK